MTPAELREIHLDRYGHVCRWPGCTLPINGFNPLQLAHLTAKGMGGGQSRNTLENTVMLCHSHHMIQEGESVRGRKREVTELLRAYLASTDPYGA